MGGSTALTAEERRARQRRMEAGRRRAAHEREVAARRQLRQDLAAARQRLRRAEAESRRADQVAARAWRSFEPYDGMPGYQDRAVYRRMLDTSNAAHRAALAHLACHDRVRLLEQQVAAQRRPAHTGAGLHIDEQEAA